MATSDENKVLHSIKKEKVRYRCSVYLLKIVILFLVPKRKCFGFPGHQISWVIDSVCDFSPWASAAMEASKETKFGTKVAWRMRMMPKLRIHIWHRESARYHTWQSKIIATSVITLTRGHHVPANKRALVLQTSVMPVTLLVYQSAAD